MNGQRCTLTLLLIAMNCCLGAQIASSQNLTKEWVEKAASPLVENRVVDGLSVGYVEGDHWGIVHLGSSNGAKEKANNLTVYEIGSVSKVFTSLLLADAVVRGEIKLNEAADVPNSAGLRLPSRDGRSIKWIDLSTHRAGLPKLPGNLVLTGSKNPYVDYDSKKAAAFLNQYELPRQPGTSQEYSNLGASVLGYLVAERAGTSYEKLLRERIAEPLKMTDCTVSLSSDQTKRLATPHGKFGSATLPWTFSDLPAAGGVHATMRDMMRFAKAQLSPPTGSLGDAIQLAWKQQSDADGSVSAMGLGWMIKGDGQTRWHNGQTGGSHSALFINRELQCAVVVLCNTGVGNEVDELAIQLVRKVAAKEAKQVKSEPVVTSTYNADKLAIDATLRSRLVGRYQLTPDFVLTVSVHDGHLMVGITNQPTQEVFPDSPTRWSYRGVDATLEFKLTETGSAKTLVLHQDGGKQSAYRIKPEPGDTSTYNSDNLPIDRKLRSRLSGRYQLRPGFNFDVQHRDGHLMVGMTNQAAQEVFPDSPTRWSYRGVDATLEFKLMKSGSAKSLVLHQNGGKQVAFRVK